MTRSDSEAAPAAGAAVTPEQLAGVSAALEDGVALSEVLEQEGIELRTWAAGAGAARERLATSPADLDVYARRYAEACEALRRRVEPLDDDLRAWIAFERALGSSGDAGAALAAAGLTTNDVLRIGSRWRERIAASPQLAAEASRWRSAPVEPAPLVRADPVRLAPFPWTPRRPARVESSDASPRDVVASFYAAGSSVLGPIASRADRSPHEPMRAPRLQAPQDRPRTLYLDADDVPRARPLPFVLPPPGGPRIIVRDAQGGRAPAPSGATVQLTALPHLPTHPFAPNRGLDVDVETYARVHVDLLRAREPRPTVLARHGIRSEGELSDVARTFRARFAGDAALREHWIRRVAELRGAMP